MIREENKMKFQVVHAEYYDEDEKGLYSFHVAMVPEERNEYFTNLAKNVLEKYCEGEDLEKELKFNEFETWIKMDRNYNFDFHNGGYQVMDDNESSELYFFGDQVYYPIDYHYTKEERKALLESIFTLRENVKSGNVPDFLKDGKDYYQKGFFEDLNGFFDQKDFEEMPKLARKEFSNAKDAEEEKDERE